MGQNEEMIQKTIETSDFLNSGLLNPEQQDRFIVLVKKFSTLLPMVRFVRMPQPKMDIDKLHVGEPVTESADENTDTGNLSKPKFNKVELVAKKVRSAWNISTETLQGNIEQDNFETTVMTAMTARIATDLEMLGIQGDITTFAGDPTPTGRLLRRLDGWGVQTEAAHVLDVGGASIVKGIFAEMKRMMPKQYRNDPGLRWIISDTIANDWLDNIADRETDVGDRALVGNAIAPYGIPMVQVSLIPDDLPVTSGATASPGELMGNQYGPFIFDSTHHSININVDGAGVVTVTFTDDTTYETREVAKAINDAYVAAHGAAYQYVASDNGMGALLLKSPTTGGASTVALTAVADDCYVLLGFPTIPVTGTGAATGGTVFEGSFIWLANPLNFIWGILDGTRIFTEFNKNFDRIESIIYNQVEAQVENLDAVVKAVNVRRAQLF